MQRRILLIDNMDSFTDNVRHLFERLGHPVTELRCDRTSLPDIQGMDPDLIIISPGPGHPQDAALSRAVVRYFLGKRPLLGICLGMQCMAIEAGGQVVPGSPCHGKAWPVFHVATGIFKGLPVPLTVGRYHSLVCTDIPPCYEAVAWTSDHIPMALQHRTLPAIGLQFHPESFLTEHGLKLAENVLHAYS